MSMSIERLMQIPYMDGGRDVSGADCWGMVVIGKRVFFSESIPHFGGYRRGKSAALAFSLEVENHYPIEFKSGAIACVFKKILGKDVFFHVGIVINNKILHTSKSKGPRFDSKKSFERLGTVKYYD